MFCIEWLLVSVSVPNLSVDDLEDSDGFSNDDTTVESFDSKGNDSELNFFWCNFTLDLKKFHFIKKNKLLVPFQRAGGGGDLFVMKLTNIYWNCFLSPQLLTSYIKWWKNLLVPELKVFIGLLLHMGSLNLTGLRTIAKQTNSSTCQFLSCI